MDLGTQISLDVVISLVSGIGGAIGAYIKLKSKIDLVEAKNHEHEKEISDLRERKKEMNLAIHKRIDDQKNELNQMQKDMATGHSSLEKQLAQLELKIIKEFQSVTDKIIQNLTRDS